MTVQVVSALQAAPERIDHAKFANGFADNWHRDHFLRSGGLRVRRTRLRLCASLCSLALLGPTGCHHGRTSPLETLDSKAALEAPWLHDSPCMTASLDHIILPEVDRTPPRTVRSP